MLKKEDARVERIDKIIKFYSKVERCQKIPHLIERKTIDVSWLKQLTLCHRKYVILYIRENLKIIFAGKNRSNLNQIPINLNTHINTEILSVVENISLDLDNQEGAIHNVDLNAYPSYTKNIKTEGLNMNDYKNKNSK